MRTIRSEVAIIGGGLMGSWTAYFLRKRGRSVTVLEKGRVGAQASGVNFGNVRIQGRFLPQLPLSLRAHDIWERSGTLLGDACEFEATGHLRIAFTEDEMRDLEDYAIAARPYGLDLQVVDRAELKRRWPWLGARVLGASWSARDGAANPRGSTAAVARVAKVLGAEIIEGQRVVAIEQVGGRFRLTTDGEVRVDCDQLLNAAGAWGAEIAASFGEKAPLFAAGPAQFVTEPVPFFAEPCVQSVDGAVIFRQVRRGNVIATGYPRGPSDAIANKAPVDPRKILKHMAHLAAVAPALASAHVIRVWSGIEGYLPDMLPVMGASRTTARLYHAFGFCGHGFQLAPGVGLVMSELLADGATPTPLEPFSIGRFEAQVEGDAARLAKEFDGGAVRAAS
jgi:sarcosine oxidase subunit beta